MAMVLQDLTFVSRFEDKEKLAALYTAAELGRRTPDEILRAFANSKYRVFALQDGRLVGAGRAFGDEVDCAVICDMAVLPQMQGSGLGEHILESIKQQVRHHLRIILYAKPGKEPFYRKRGFRPLKTAMITSHLVPGERNRAAGIIE